MCKNVWVTLRKKHVWLFVFHNENAKNIGTDIFTAHFLPECYIYLNYLSPPGLGCSKQLGG